MILSYSKFIVFFGHLLIIFSHRGRKLSAVHPHLINASLLAAPALAKRDEVRIALIEGGDFRVTVKFQIVLLSRYSKQLLVVD
jgi:hypothetical protein